MDAPKCWHLQLCLLSFLSEQHMSHYLILNLLFLSLTFLSQITPDSHLHPGLSSLLLCRLLMSGIKTHLPSLPLLLASTLLHLSQEFSFSLLCSCFLFFLGICKHLLIFCKLTCYSIIFTTAELLCCLLNKVPHTVCKCFEKNSTHI